LIAVSPTAMTGALLALISEAASSATPSATEAVSKPVNAPATSRRTVACPDVLITGLIRNCRRGGLVSLPIRAGPSPSISRFALLFVQVVVI
jgi:hypothetical protein